jgi:hypothetical protein
LPALAFLSGLLSLTIDPAKNPKGKWVLVLMLVVTAAGTIGLSVHDDNTKKTEETTADNNITFLKNTISDLTGKTTHIDKVTGQLYDMLTTWGFSHDDVTRISQSTDADKARTSMLSQTQAINSQKKATVWYFPKNVDGPTVTAALDQGGFNVIRKIGRETNAAIPTNAIWVGGDVSLDQAKFVALTLMRAGVQIKVVRRLRDGTGDKANVIEVGSDGAFRDATPMSVDDVDKLTLPARAAV